MSERVYGEAVNRLISSFKGLPGIGQRTAERLAFHLLLAPKAEAFALADALRDVKERAKPCGQCFHVTETDPCPICADPRRERGTICVVERPPDVLAMEKSGGYRGLYHVLLGSVSLIEGVDPEDLTIGPLVERVRRGGIQEVILATNPNIEGDATALYLARLLQPVGVRITRLAYGISVGTEIEYADAMSLARALQNRTDFS